MKNSRNLRPDLVYDIIVLCFLHLLHFGTLQRKLGVIFTFKELLKTTGSRNKSQWFSEDIVYINIVYIIVYPFHINIFTSSQCINCNHQVTTSMFCHSNPRLTLAIVQLCQNLGAHLRSFPELQTWSEDGKPHLYITSSFTSRLVIDQTPKRIHVNGIFTYMNGWFMMVNVGKYTIVPWIRHGN